MSDPSRRQFLGAAAAAATLPTAASETATGEPRADDAPQPEVNTPVEGSSAVSFSADVYDFDASFEVRTYTADPNAVAVVHAGIPGGVAFSLDFDAEQARDVGEALLEAAERAEGGQ